MKQVILGLMVFLVSDVVIGQVRGKVLDATTGETLPGAHVYFRSQQSAGTTTLPDGTFTLAAPSNFDTLLVTYIGFRIKKITPPYADTLLIYLEPSSAEIAEVVIKAEKLIAEEFVSKKIRKIEIYTNPSAKADPLLAVNSMPSATTLDESANISLRGSSPAETGIFLNNVPINDAVRYSQLNGIGTFSIFNTALISNVQVFPGNPPLEFGNTTSGLIALQTDETQPEKAISTASVSLANIGFYQNRKAGKNGSLTMFSNYQPSALLKFVNPKALSNLKKFNSLDLGIHYFRKIGSATVLKIFNYGIRESYVFQYSHPTYSGNFAQDKWRNFTVTNIRRRFSNGEFSLNNGVSFSSAKYAFGNVDIDLKLQDFFLSANYQHFVGKTEFKVGTSYDYKSSNFKGQFPLYNYAQAPHHPAGTDSTFQSVTLPEIYGYVKYFLTGNLVLGGGLRKNIPADNFNNFLSSQFNVHWKPAKGFSITGSAGSYNKVQLPQGESNKPIQIHANQYSLDMAYQNRKTESSIAFFYKESKQADQFNEIMGLEIYGRYRFTPGVKAQLSITSLNTQVITDGIETLSPYDIRYFIRGNIEAKFSGTWTLTTVLLVRQGSFFIPVRNTNFDSGLNVYVPEYGTPDRLPSYRNIELSLSKIFQSKRSSTVAFIGLGNMLDFNNIRGYEYNFDYSQKTPSVFSKRTLYFGAVVTW